MFRKNPTMRQSEVWFAGDIANLLTGLDAVPLPSGDYEAGWRNALSALAASIGYERIEAVRSPMVSIVPNDQQIDAPVFAMLALQVGREVTR